MRRTRYVPAPTAALLLATAIILPRQLHAQARLGDVDFPVSVSGAARDDFLLGLRYLHSFEYADAATAFRAAQRHRPAFALAYWGEALTYDHPLWGQEDLAAARAVLARLDEHAAQSDPAATPRERAYVDAARTLFGKGSKAQRDSAYESAMADLASAYPDDEDAAAFHALAILGTAKERDHETYMRAAAVALGVLAEHPEHPGALHYLIHAVDDPVHAGLGLPAARAYARIAPDASHALHMPSHIFFAVGMWDALVDANQKAWDVSVERMERLGLPPRARNFHALYWLHYGDLQLGHAEEAARLLAISEAAAAEGQNEWSAAMIRAQHVAEVAGADPVLIERALSEPEDGTARVPSALAVAAAAWRMDDASLLQRAKERAEDVAASEEELGDEEEIALAAIRALSIADRRPDSALVLLGQADDRYDSLPYVFGPPAVVKPPGELQGELLLKLGRRAEAAASFRRALERAPGRRASVAGLARAAGAARSSDGSDDATSSLAIVDVTVVPMDSEQELPGRTVIVTADRITAIGPVDSVSIPSGAQIIPGRGRFLMPGLIDSHVHLRSHRELLSYLRYGVTTIINLSGTLRGAPDILATRREVESGELAGPTIYTAGPVIDGDPPIFPAVSTVVTSPEQAKAVIEQQHELGYDFIKLYNNAAPDVVVAAIAAAHVRHMAAFGHIPRHPDRATALQKALDAGLDVIAHAEEIFFTYYYAGVEELLDEGQVPYRDTTRVDDAATLVRDAGAALIPNLSFVAATRQQLDDMQRILDDPEMAFLDADTREMWVRRNATTRPDRERFDRRERAKYPFLQKLTLAMAERGVPLFVGTDTSLPGLFPGRSAHLELQELVKAGLTPFSALVAATRAPGAFIAARVANAPLSGVIAPGNRADLVLLDADPLADIRNASRIVGVVVRGQWSSVEELDALRSTAEN